MAKKCKSPDTKYIQNIIDENKINVNDIKALSGIDYPLFSFRWLQNVSFCDCTDEKFFHSFLSRLQKLSELGWNGIRKAGRHQYGLEKISKSQLKPTKFPKIVTPEVEEFDVFRATGDNRPMVGLQQGKIFHVIFIEASFGDIYNHN